MNKPAAATNPFETDLDPCPANYAPLTPLSFLTRTERVFPDQLAVVHGPRRYTWKETAARCRRLGSALARRGVGPGTSVAILAANTPELYEAHFGVPMTGAVLNTLNTRLDAGTIAYCLDHGEASVLITDREFAQMVRAALAQIGRKLLIIDIDDPQAKSQGPMLGEIDYESFLAEGDPTYDGIRPANEWQAITLNYTSGTTGRPKGVVYHHRGAYLTALGNVVSWGLADHPVYLWTLPMFHCNGWCFPWTLAAVAGTSVCLRQVTGPGIFHAIAHEKVNHFCGAPIVLSLVASTNPADRPAFDHKVKVMTAAAPPPASTLEQMQRQGFDVTHVYGLTETYGPAVVCDWHHEWNELPIEEQAALKSRQGVPYHVLEDVTIRDPDSLDAMPADGASLGEVMFRGNVVMKGYLKDPEATQAAFKGGWFHSGDLGVLHPDGYIQLKDRSKDIIISGGENISSIEVENVLHRHPAVAIAAVVARPDDKWGETPCAFLELKPDAGRVTEDEIIAFCREHLAHYKCPRTVIFTELPKTSTGKIQKYRLRETAKELD